MPAFMPPPSGPAGQLPCKAERSLLSAAPRLKRLMPLAAGLFLLTACDKEDDGYFYPSLITEFAELQADGTGTGVSFTTDGGEDYAINSPLGGLQPDAVYRVVCGYEPTGGLRDGLPVARLYTLENAVLLQPSEAPSAEDEPTGVTAVWRGGGYLNLQLTPKTQGGTQLWGYRTDSVRTAASGQAFYHFSLYHRQPDDPYSYSATVYASLPLFQVDGLQPGDSLSFTALTFEGRKTWRFAY